MRFVALLLCIQLLAACGERRFPRPDFESLEFKTTEQAKLFFKNVRSFYYEADLYSFKGAEVYRWADREKDTSLFWINPVLVIHLQQDQVFILTEASPAVQSNCAPFLYRETDVAMDSIRWTPSSMHDHFNLNVFVYDAIDMKARLYLRLHDGQKVELLTKEKQQSNYHKQIRDFLRLVGAI